MNIIERIDRPCEYVEVAQTALIACQYLYLWLFAGPDDAYKVYSLAILMAFEFVMVHSGLFMAAMPLKASIRLFIPLYGLFAFGHSMREGDYTIVILYLATVLNRMRFAFFNVSKSVKQRVVKQSMIALAVYFVLTVSVVCAESVIPSFSLGAAFSESASYTREVRAGGLFVEKPYVPICLGFLVHPCIRQNPLFLPEISVRHSLTVRTHRMPVRCHISKAILLRSCPFLFSRQPFPEHCGHIRFQNFQSLP